MAKILMIKFRREYIETIELYHLVLTQMKGVFFSNLWRFVTASSAFPLNTVTYDDVL